MRLHPRQLGQRVATLQTPILAKQIPAGVTGEIVELRGYRAYGVRFDGNPIIYGVFPEEIKRVPSATPAIPAPSPFQRRGRRAQKGA